MLKSSGGGDWGGFFSAVDRKDCRARGRARVRRLLLESSGGKTKAKDIAYSSEWTGSSRLSQEGEGIPKDSFCVSNNVAKASGFLMDNSVTVGTPRVKSGHLSRVDLRDGRLGFKIPYSAAVWP